MKNIICISLVVFSMLAFSVAARSEQSHEPFYKSVIKAADFNMTCHAVPVAVIIENQTDAILVCVNVERQAYQVTDIVPVSRVISSDVHCNSPPDCGMT